MSLAIDQLKQVLTDFKASPHKEKSLAEIKEIVEKMALMNPSTETSVYYLIYSNILDHTIRRKLLYDIKLEYNHDQAILIKKINEFLKNQLKKILLSLNEGEQKKYKESEDYKNRMRVLESLASVKEEANGECVGLSTLWAYGKRISNEPEAENQKERDDIAFFYKNWKRLLLWDEKQEITTEENADIERFIANVRHYQIRFGGMAWAENTSGDQLDLSYSLSDTKRGSPVKSFDQKITCDQAILESRLAMVVKPKSMIFLGCGTRHESGHMMSIYQDADNRIYFYDSNHPGGEILVEDLKHLAKLIWQQTHPENFESSGIDPLEDYLRKDLWIEIFRFKEDPEYQYPTAQTFKPSVEEFLILSNKIPNFTFLAFKYQIKALMDSLDEFQIIEILGHAKVDAELKMSLVENAVLDRKDKTPILARYILQHHNDLFDKILARRKNMGDIKQYTEKFIKGREELESLSKERIDAKLYFGSIDQIEYLEKRAEYIEKNYIGNNNNLSKIKHLLTLNEVLNILENDKNIGNHLLAEELLGSCMQGTDTFFPGLWLVLDKNIAKGNLDLAKIMTRKIKDRFDILVSAKGIEDLGSEDYARFMHVEYGNAYLDRFGTPQLEYMPEIINTKRIIQKKKEIMDVMTNLMVQNMEVRDRATIEKFTNLALEMKDALTLNEALTILTINPGNLELAEKLLNSCKNSDEKLFSLYLVLHENIQGDSLPVAEATINILAKRFNILPSLKAIEDLGSEKFATFMHEKYGDQFLDKLGNSQLKYLANKISINHELHQKRTDIMKEIDKLLEIEGSKRGKKELDASMQVAIENQMLLTPSDVMKVLLLNLGNVELAKDLLNNCVARIPSKDFYVDRDLLVRVLNENFKIEKTEVVTTIINIASQKYNLDYLLLSSRKELDPKVYGHIEKLISDEKAEKGKAEMERKTAIEKDQALQEEKEKKGK